MGIMSSQAIICGLITLISVELYQGHHQDIHTHTDTEDHYTHEHTPENPGHSYMHAYAQYIA